MDGPDHLCEVAGPLPPLGGMLGQCEEACSSISCRALILLIQASMICHLIRRMKKKGVRTEGTEPIYDEDNDESEMASQTMSSQIGASQMSVDSNLWTKNEKKLLVM